MIYTELILNLTLLVTLSVFSCFIDERWQRHTKVGILMQGVLFGGAATVGMLHPMALGPGLIFDGRTIMVSLSALYFGPWTVSIATLLTITCRVWLGGKGMVVGLLVVLSSAGIGLLARLRLKPEEEPPSTWSLYLFGLAVHFPMVALFLLLPASVAHYAVKSIAVPAMLLYPLATVLAGKNLTDRISTIQHLTQVEQSRLNLDITLQSIGDAVISTDLGGRIVLMNPVAEVLTGWSREEARNKPLEEVFRIVNEHTRAKVEDPVARVLSEGAVVGLANHTLLIAREGSERPVADSGAPIRTGDGTLTGVVLVFRDQTSERASQKLTRTRLDLIEYAATHTLSEFLCKALDEIGAFVESPIGFYHFVENDQKTISLQQWSTRTLKEFCTSEDKDMHYGIEQAGVWVDCVMERKPVIHNDYSSLPHKRGMPAGHAKVIRELVVPVMREGNVVAILGVGNKPADYTEKDSETVSYLADVTWEIVKHKHAEEEINRTNTYLENIFENSPDAIGIVDASGNFIRWNKMAAELYGYTFEEMRSKSGFDLYADKDELEKMLVHLRREGSVKKWEMEMRRKDSSVVPFEISISLLQDNQHRTLGSVCVARDLSELKKAFAALKASNDQLTRDIAERKKAQKALLESERRLSQIIDFLPDATFVIDLQGKILAWNRAMEQLSGARAEDMLGKGNYEYALPFYGTRRPILVDLLFMPDEEINQKYVSYNFFKRDGDMLLTEANINMNGVERVFWAKARPLYDAEGGVTGAIETIRDVTDRKRAEEAFREGQARLDLAVRSAHMGVWSLDIRENRRHFDHQACHLLGIDPARFDGSADEFFRVVHPEDHEGIEAAMHQVVNEDVPYETDYRAVWPDGSVHFIRTRGRLLRDDEGRPKAVNGILWDISESKLADEEKQKLETQLHQAQKLEAIGTLAGGIAHDFNNILAAIMGYTELALLDVPKDTLSHHGLKEVLIAANRAKDLVRQILAFSRQGEMQARKPIEIAPVIEEALKLLRATLPSTIELRQRVSTDQLTVMCDPTQVHQVVVNLCTNAAQAMRDNGGILEVNLEEVVLDAALATAYENVQPGSYVHLAVKDTGHGMDAATLERIFDPYFTTKGVGEGSGLGLAVVSGIVKRHEGAIRVQSEPGKGTLMEIILPKLKNGDVRAKEELEPLTGGTEHILFVDDEKPLASLAEQMLVKLGYHVTVRTSSLDAIDLFRSEPDAFDLVITDYTMPHMTGVELAKMMLKVRPDIPVVLCTGYSEMVSEDKARETGIRAFLMKPLGLRDFARVIRNVLNRAE